ncbi:MAG: hypothetical protein VXW22_02295 [Pseudomonadota bacterium]|nr:hypothetical protein [Pseudomonadota bacterium]
MRHDEGNFANIATALGLAALIAIMVFMSRYQAPSLEERTEKAVAACLQALPEEDCR